VAQLERGAVTVRGFVLGAPPDVLKSLSGKNTARFEPGKTSGFGLIDLRQLIADVAPEPLAAGVTWADAVKQLAGPVTIAVPAGQLTLDMQVPFADVSPIAKVVQHCDELPPLQGAATVEGDVCHLNLRQAKLDAWVEGNLLRVGKRGTPAPPVDSAMSPAGVELGTGEWGLTFWGRGTMFSQSHQAMPDLGPDAIDPLELTPLRIMSMVNEAGVGLKVEGEALRFVATLRTSFANPDDVMAKLTDISAMDLMAERAATKAQAVAEAHPTSPFAADYHAGQGGLLVPTTIVGMAATVVVPVVLRYLRGRPAPAEVMEPGGPVRVDPSGLAPPPPQPDPGAMQLDPAPLVQPKPRGHLKPAAPSEAPP
jgi:hypothetical protein